MDDHIIERGNGKPIIKYIIKCYLLVNENSQENWTLILVNIGLKEAEHLRVQLCSIPYKDRKYAAEQKQGCN